MADEVLGKAKLVLITDASNLNQGISGAKKSSSNLQKSFLVASAAISASIIKIGVDALELSRDFEKSMSKIEGLVGISADQVERWSDDLKKLGPALGAMPQELADAMFFIASAGFEGDEAMQVLLASSKAAKAGLGEIETVADAVTSAINAYGKENLGAGEATDILVATVREGKMNADSLAGSIGNIVSLSSKMGIEFDEVGAALASMTRVGLSTERATTSLQGIMAGLLKPAEQTIDAFSEIGLDMEEVRQHIREKGLLSTLMMLEDRLDGDTAAMSRLFPNVEGLRGVLSVLGENAETSAEIMEELSDAAGSTDDAFKVASRTIDHQMNVAMSNLQSSLITIGETIAPIIVPIIVQLTDHVVKLANAFASAGPIIIDIIKKMRFGPWATILPIVLPLIKDLVGSFGEAGELGPKVLPFLEKVIGTFADIIANVGPRVLPFLENLVGKIGSVIADIGPKVLPFLEKVIGTFADIITNIGPRVLPFLENLVGKIGSVIADIGPKVLPFLEKVIGTFADIIANVGPRVLPFLENLVGKIGSVIADIGPKVLPFLEKVIGTFADILSELGPMVIPFLENLLTIFGNIMAELGPVVIPFLKNLLTIFSEILSELGPMVLPFLEKLLTTFGEILSELGPVVIPFLEKLLTTFSEILAELGPVVIPFLEKLLTTFSEILIDLGPVVIPFLENLLTIFSDIMAELGPVVIPFLENLLTIFGNIMAELGPVVLPFLEKLLTIFSEILAELSPIVIPFLEDLLTIFSEIMDALGPIFQEIANQIILFDESLTHFGEKVRETIDNIIVFFVDLKDQVIDIVKNMIQGVGDWFENRFAAIGEGVREIVDKIGGFFADLANKVVGQSIVPDMVNSILEWFLYLDIKTESILIRMAKTHGEKWSEMADNTIYIAKEMVSSINSVLDAFYNWRISQFEAMANESIAIFQQMAYNQLNIEGLTAEESAEIMQELAQQRIAMQIEIAEKMNEIYIEQAKTQKAIALITIAIDTASAVMSAYARLPLEQATVLSAFLIALGATQAALVMATPIPAPMAISMPEIPELPAFAVPTVEPGIIDTDMIDYTGITGEGYMGAAATFQQQRPIIVTMDIHDNQVYGASLREFAIMMRDEIEAVGELGL